MRNLYVLLIALILMSGCSNETTFDKNKSRQTGVPVTVSLILLNEEGQSSSTEETEKDQTQNKLSVKSLCPDIQTKAISPAVMLDNFWILQFNGSDINAPLAATPRYFTSFSNETGLISGKGQRVIIVGNTYNPNLFTKDKPISTYQSFLNSSAQTASVIAQIGSNLKDPVSGNLVTDISDGNTIKVRLSRSFAKVSFKVKSFVQGKTTIQLRSVPVRSYYWSQRSGTFPVFSAGNIDADLYDYAPINTIQLNSNQYTEFSFFMPVNQRGNVPGTTSKQRVTNAPKGATYLQITNTLDNGDKYIYKIHTGSNFTDDYNIKPNFSYSYSLSLYNSNFSEDSRVEFEEMPQISNCFMVNPSEGAVTISLASVNLFWGKGGDGAIATSIQNRGASSPVPIPSDLDYVVTQNLITDTNYSVEKIWSDTNNPNIRVTNLTVKSFTIENLTKEGNYVIGVTKKAGSKSYLWSWHIWVTTYNPDKQSIPINGTIIGMDRNLGATTNTYSGLTGLLYQWGRKDPFPGAAQLMANALPATVYGTQMTVSPVDKGTLITCAQNPSVFYASSFSSSDAISSGYLSKSYGLNRWQILSATNKVNMINKSKTLYDPCPKGWRVPTLQAWENFTDRNFSWYYDSRLLYYSSGINYFPATGFRDPSGKLVGVATDGYYWTSSANDLYGNVMFFTSNRLESNTHGYKAAGMPVRCIKE